MSESGDTAYSIAWLQRLANRILFSIVVMLTSVPPQLAALIEVA